MRTIFGCLLVMLGAFSAPAAAQGFVSAGVGAGGAVGDRDKDASGKGVHGSAYVQLRVPIFPIALRFDALLAKSAADETAPSLMTSAVYVLPVPFVQPYVMAGHGRYFIGKAEEKSGWNAGLGVRVRTPVVAVYGEVRRHQRLGRDLLTIGISR